MAEKESNRSEPATPLRRQEARRRGSVARSAELASLLALLTLLGALLLWARGAVQQQLRLSGWLFGQAHALSFDAVAVLAWGRQLLAQGLTLLAPLLAALVVVAVLGGLLQGGLVLSTHPLKPDVQRLNPVAGFKRVVSLRLLYETGKTLVKLVLFGAALWLIGRSLLPALLALAQLAPAQWPQWLLAEVTAIVARLLALLGFIVALDLLYTRWHWLDQLRMSRRELREELKNREGDPRIRSRLRELRREMLKRSQAVRRLPEADVLITNPTHLAVALQYRRERMAAPEVVAKASGEMALQLREMARRHRVPVVANPTLARALYRGTGLGEPIPEALYPAVARLLVWVAALRPGAAGTGTGGGAAAEGRA